MRIGAYRTRLITFVAILAIATSTLAQTSPLTIAAAVDLAQREHPSSREATERAAAALAGIDEARAAYVPRLDGLWQLNRASRNNVFGLLLPQAIVPSISGPVLGTDSFESAWGSAAGLLFSVEVFDFGRRVAAVDAARARAESRSAAAEAARLDAAVAAADAFLSTLGAEQNLRAARASVDRLEVFHRTVKAKVDAELRPGADLSRVEAELASARNQLVVVEQALSLARLRLAAAIGQPEATPTINPGSLLEQPADNGVGVGNHKPPVVRAAELETRAAEAGRQVVERTFRPKVFLNGAIASRASGANIDGTIDNGHGLWPDIPNWAAGVTVSFPFLDLATNRARVRVEAATVRAADAHLNGVTQQARVEVLRAQVMADAANRIAMNTPIQVAAARQAEMQARARYEAGLTGVTELADAQRLLAQAESEGSLATLATWRARLARAAAEGDLTEFLAEATRPRAAKVLP